MKPLALALAASLIATPACAGGWKEASFIDLAGHVFDEGGVRVSNCHLEWHDTGGLKAAPKCYVLNTSGKPAEARIEFSALDEAGQPVIATALAVYPLQDMTGAEFSQFLPVTAEEQARVRRARVRVLVSGR